MSRFVPWFKFPKNKLVIKNILEKERILDPYFILYAKITSKMDQRPKYKSQYPKTFIRNLHKIEFGNTPKAQIYWVTSK